MNIAINTLPLSTEHRMRGTGVYTKNLIDALQKYEKKLSYTFFTRVTDIPKNTDLVHYPFFDPFFLTLPFPKPFPTVVTVHDLIPLVFPDKFPAGIRGSLKWQLQRASLGRAAAVVTDSNCSKKDIMRIMGKPSSWVHVVPLAPSVHYSRVTNESALSDARKRYQLPEQYVLYVGDVNWNKNVSGLIKAWKYVREKSPKVDTKLVLIGSAFTNFEIPETRAIVHLIDMLGVGKSIVRPGFVRNEDMTAVYSAASCVVLPSWYEGFGFPVLEAFECGVPVIASNRGSVPEIAGPAKMIDPSHPNDIGNAIVDMLRMSEKERLTLVKKGFAWAKQFSWQRVARETTAVYERITGI
ncbi:MAG TPA: glycosyltransferase family 1 protein [Patescibacteria group bacterium]|nr:glycosyltransferase family 1 protein [Patescibacteria group bacterium]